MCESEDVVGRSDESEDGLPMSFEKVREREAEPEADCGWNWSLKERTSFFFLFFFWFQCGGLGFIHRCFSGVWY